VDFFEDGGVEGAFSGEECGFVVDGVGGECCGVVVCCCLGVGEECGVSGGVEGCLVCGVDAYGGDYGEGSEDDGEQYYDLGGEIFDSLHGNCCCFSFFLGFGILCFGLMLWIIFYRGVMAAFHLLSR